MKVSDVMTRRVVSVAPEATIRHAIRLMLDNHISGLPVIDDKGKLVGIVSEGDFLRRSEIGTERKRSHWLDAFLGPGAPANDYVHSHGFKVKEVMTRKPITVQEDTPLDQVVHLMESLRVKRLPVVRGEKVVGVVSRVSLMRALAVPTQALFLDNPLRGLSAREECWWLDLLRELREHYKTP